MKKQWKKVIWIGASIFLGIYLISTIPFLITYSLQDVSTNKRENNTPDKLPILNINDTNQKIDFSSLVSKDDLKIKYKEAIFNKIDSEKLNYYYDKYNLKTQIDQAIDESFEIFINSKDFLKLNTSNDINIFNNNFDLMINKDQNKNIENINKILASKINWDYNFVSLLFKNEITINLFKKINDSFCELFDNNIQKNYLSNSFEQIKSNDKFKWLMQQANVEQQQIDTLLDNYINQQNNEYQLNYLVYQKILFQMYAFDNLKYTSLDKQIFNNLNTKEAQIKKSLYDISMIVRYQTFITFKNDEFMWYTFSLWEDNIFSVKYDNVNLFDYIKQLYLLIKDDLSDPNSHIYNKEIIDLLNNETIIKMLDYMSKATEESLEEFKNWMNNNIEIVKEPLNKFNNLISKNLALIFNTISYLNLYNFDTLSYYLFNNDYLLNSKSINLINQIIEINQSLDSDNKDLLIYSKIKEFLTSLTNKQYKTNQEMIADLYILNVPEIANYLNDNVDIIEMSFKYLNCDFTSTKNILTQFSKFAKIVEKLINDNWKYTMLTQINSNDNYYALSIIVANTIIDKNILNNTLNNLLNNTVSQAKDIIDMIISPQKGVEDLEKYCKDNNVIIKNIS